MPRPRLRRPMMVTVGLMAAIGGLVSQTASAVPTTSTTSVPAQSTASPIKHVVEIMLENHSFDNLFGGFPGANGIPKNTSLLSPNATYDSAPNVSPVWASPNEGDVYGGISNSRAAEQMAMDYAPGKGYQMDHYTTFPQDGMASITEFGPQFDPNLLYLASHYELEDHNFQPAVSPTQPNVMYSLNADAHGWMYNNLNPDDNAPWNSIFDQLAAHDHTGKVYYGVPPAHLDGTIWDKIVPPDLKDLSTADQFYSDVKQGNLPDFSFVRPGVGYSEEPQEDIAQGDAWLGQLVNAVADSKYWNSTAIFVTYDEGGGFWDHVAPPIRTPYGYGERTPTVVISPYARTGVYDHETTNMSILSFMQKAWGLPPLNSLNAQQNDLSGAFDFKRTPLPAPKMPVAPTDTIAFRGSSDTSDLPAPNPGSPLTVNLEANGGGLNLDSSASGPVSLTVTPPKGVTVPAGFPSNVNLSGGRGSFTTTFTHPGYYRIEATGPNGSKGWTTVDVGVNANTTPTP